MWDKDKLVNDFIGDSFYVDPLKLDAKPNNLTFYSKKFEVVTLVTITAVKL